MAFPIILCNTSTGSDTAASGAGPGTAISGANGRTRPATDPTRFGLFGATDDLSGVATDGSHCIFASIATAGRRNFASITGIKNTRETGSDGVMTSGSAVLTVGSTTGWSVGDVVKVAGAGSAGADYYSTVLTVDSSVQATMNDNAGTTVATAAWENPKQTTTANLAFQTASGTDAAWAIGGKRLTISGTNSKKLFDNNSAAGDAMPGWTVEMESGFTDTFSATYTFRRAGTVTNGPIILRGTFGAATPPVLTFSNNGNALSLAADYQQLANFTMVNTNATKTASVAVLGSSNNTYMASRLKIADSTNNFWKAFVQGGGALIYDCEVGYCAAAGINMQTSSAQGLVVVDNCWVHDCAVNGITVSSNADFATLRISRSLIEDNTGDGIQMGISGATGGRGVTIDANTIDGNSDDGIAFGQTSAHLGLIGCAMINNIISNNQGWGRNFTGAGMDDNILRAFAFVAYNNVFYNNTLGTSSLTVTNAFNEVEGTDPGFTNAGSNDFSISSTSPAKAVGWPTSSRFIGNNASATKSYTDVGAAQRQETGLGYKTHPGMTGGMNG